MSDTNTPDSPDAPASTNTFNNNNNSLNNQSSFISQKELLEAHAMLFAENQNLKRENSDLRNLLDQNNKNINEINSYHSRLFQDPTDLFNGLSEYGNIEDYIDKSLQDNGVKEIVMRRLFMHPDFDELLSHVLHQSGYSVFDPAMTSLFTTLIGSGMDQKIKNMIAMHSGSLYPNIRKHLNDPAVLSNLLNHYSNKYTEHYNGLANDKDLLVKTIHNHIQPENFDEEFLSIGGFGSGGSEEINNSIKSALESIGVKVDDIEVSSSDGEGEVYINFSKPVGAKNPMAGIDNKKNILNK